jgi:tetratricopeptide (TPR) repeat protein
MHASINSFRSYFALASLTSAILLLPCKSSHGQTTPATQPAAEQDQYLTMIQEVDRLIDEGKYAEAFNEYNRITQTIAQAIRDLTVLPERVLTYEALIATGRGRALAAMKDYEAAMEVFQEVLNVYADFAPALVARGEMFLEVGMAREALPDFQKVAKSNRGDLRTLFGLGKSLAMLGQWEQAIRPLTQVIEAEGFPKKAEAYRLRGASQAGNYKFAEAFQDINKSIELDPEDHEAYFELAIVHMRNEDYSAAIKEIDRSIEKYKPPVGLEEEPFLQAYLLKSSLLVEVGKKATDEAARQAAYQAAVDAAQFALSKLDERNPNTAQVRASALLSRGVGERMLGQYGQAIRTLSQALELNPALAEAYFRRGICFHHIGEDELAVSDFKQAAVINFDDPRGNLWEGFVYASLGNYYEAVRAYGDAIAASDRYTPAYVNRGLAYMQLGEYEKAIADLDQAIRIEPTKADYYYKRGVAYLQLSDLPKARDSFVSAIQFDPEMVTAYRQLSSVLRTLGNVELAEQYRQKAAALDAAKTAG